MLDGIVANNSPVTETDGYQKLLTFNVGLRAAISDGRPMVGCLPYFHTRCGLSANLGAGLKRAARGSLEMQDAKKNRQKVAMCTP